MGIMLPSHRDESCLQVDNDTFFLPLTDESTSSVLTKGNEEEFTTSISTTTSKYYKDLFIYDIDLTKIESNNWCTGYSTSEADTIITPGSVA